MGTVLLIIKGFKWIKYEKNYYQAGRNSKK